MPRYDLSADETIRVLAGERVVRVAFRDGETSYLIPLGYVWLDSALLGVADPGRKTRMAESNPSVAFQVDTSAETGVFEWESVTGDGTFQVVVDEAERQQAIAALQPVIAQAPEWWQREQVPRMAAGSLVVWKITPTRISGCRYAPATE
jgi:nitroimidazol reductase NimA-like FMN-containing flavoprotein (pyridoxamine 5'-phosphate oxidase superfamily)